MKAEREIMCVGSTTSFYIKQLNLSTFLLLESVNKSSTYSTHYFLFLRRTFVRMRERNEMKKENIYLHIFHIKRSQKGIGIF